MKIMVLPFCLVKCCRYICKEKIQSVAYLSVLMLLAFSTLTAQNAGKVSGIIKDAETGELLIGCNVSILGTMMGSTSDIEGVFYILNVSPGKYDIQASLIGYQKVVQRGTIVNSARTTVVNFVLTSTALQQKEVIIEATRPDVEREKTSTSTIVRAEEVQALAGIRDVGDVLGLAADVTDGHFRGGRDGEEFYTLQGMGIVNPLNNTTAFLPIMSAVEEVEVITSGFGAQYGNAQSGVVNISMKEGKSDRWRTRVETRMRTPGRKHFGPSVYDPSANPYLAALLDPTVWLRGDPNANNVPYYISMGSGLNNMYAGDTLVQLQVARTLWLMQTKRDLLRKYGNRIDYSAEVGTGGPIDDNMKMFLAFRSNVDWPVFPTEQPNKQSQVMGNIVTDITSGASLRLSGGFTEDNTNVFPSSSALGYFTWLWDRILSINYRKTTNLQLGARFTHTLSSSTFYEIKLNSLQTRRKIGSSPSPSSVADSLIINPQNHQIDWDKMIPQVVGSSSPDGFSYLRGDDEFRDELTRTTSLDGSITSQVTKSHLLNGGIQFNSYLIDVSNSLNTRRGAGGPVEKYRVRPFEAAVFVQDKMEFEGMIANVGLRLDLWDPNTEYYPDVVVPYRQYYTSENGDSTWWTYNKDLVKKKKTPAIGRLQPRVGISFPVSVSTVFHLNYGSFMQRPSFQYIVSSHVQQGSSEPIRLGNPRLLPETTNSYDVGVTQGLGEGFTLDISGYYKDVKNLIETVTYTSGSYSYSSWFNRDYADIRGFRVALSKRRGELTGSVNYQYSVATGKSGTTSYAPVAYIEDPRTHQLITNLEKVPVRDILLDFDRTHNLIINLAYATNDNWGPEFAGIYPFENLTLSTNSFLRSGRPYTSPQNAKLINGSRTPAEYNTNARLTKKINRFFGTTATIYFEVFNLFNNKILNYSYIFSTPNANTTSTIVNNYENYSISDRNNGILYWPNSSPPLDWGVDQSFLIYSNVPRSFTLGFAIEL
jgi:outer membrane receptor protein involved in Fe transport